MTDSPSPFAARQETERALDEAAKKEEAAINEEERKAREVHKRAVEAEAAKEGKEGKASLTKAQVEHKKKIEETHHKIEDILKKYSGLESNVPYNHEYWGLQNQLRALHNEPV